jgi:hypothetical protein
MWSDSLEPSRLMVRSSDDRPLSKERRRHPRAPAQAGVELSMPILTHGEVLDLSESGALLSTTMGLAVGERTRLSLLVGREPFSAWAKVVRAEPGTRAERTTRYHIGVVFTSVDAHNRQVLSRFVRREPSGR